MSDFEEMGLYFMWSADEACQKIANSADPSDPVIQRRILREYGIELDDLSDRAVDYLSEKVNHYLT